jgi:hypothetical protein
MLCRWKCCACILSLFRWENRQEDESIEDPGVESRQKEVVELQENRMKNLGLTDLQDDLDASKLSGQIQAGSG